MNITDYEELFYLNIYKKKKDGSPPLPISDLQKDVFIIQPQMKTSLTSLEGKLNYGLLTESFSEGQRPRLVPEVSFLLFYFHPVDVKLQAARCDLGQARRTFSGGGFIGRTWGGSTDP